MKTKKLVLTALLLAIGTLLSFIQIIRLPFGGAVTLASMVPIVLISYIYGTKWGLFSSFVYALLQILSGMGTVSAFFMPGESQMVLWMAVCVCVLDYLLAYTMLGFGGIFKNKLKNSSLEISLGAVVSLFLRFLVHIISGAVFFGSWASWFFGDESGLSQIPALSGFCSWVIENLSGNAIAVLYSVIYNGAYMIPEIIITVIIAPVIFKALKLSLK